MLTLFKPLLVGMSGNVTKHIYLNSYTTVAGKAPRRSQMRTHFTHSEALCSGREDQHGCLVLYLINIHSQLTSTSTNCPLWIHHSFRACDIWELTSPYSSRGTNQSPNQPLYLQQVWQTRTRGPHAAYNEYSYSPANITVVRNILIKIL